MDTTVDDILSSCRTGRLIVMGILNVTPDSFSDGGSFIDPAAAVEQARRMIDDGAEIIDVGAESTRPGAVRISAADQIARLRDVLPAVCRLGAPVSIDTTRAAVAEMALDAGAVIINDVSAGLDDAALLPLAGRRQAPVVLMHMLGQPATMQVAPRYDDVVADVRRFLAERLDAAALAGVHRHQCIVDPGIGFGKRPEHNLTLLARLGELKSLGCPIMVGPSRKRFIGDLTGEPHAVGRVAGTIAACLAALRGGATIFRVHDVKAVRQAIIVTQAIAAMGQHTQ